MAPQIRPRVHNHRPANGLLMAVAGLALAVAGAGVQQVRASGIFEINLSALVDSYGRDLRDDCCNWQNSSAEAAVASLSNLQQPGAQAQLQACDPTKCQLIIRICVKNYQTQIEPSQCTFGELSAQVIKPNEPQQYFPQYSFRPNSNNHHLASAPSDRFQNQQHQPKRTLQQPVTAANIHHQRMLFQQQQQLHQTPFRFGYSTQTLLPAGQPRAMRTIAFNQPITFPFNFTWPGSFSLIIDAWYESPTGLQQVPLPFAGHHKPSSASNPLSTTYDLYKKQLIIEHSMHGWLAVKNEWTNGVHKTDTASLSYSYRVTCQTNYFGDQCNRFCHPRDDVFGHYTCSSQGSPVCLPGWQDAYCSKPICSPGCHKDQGSCTRPNECKCRIGWQGPNCDQCVRYPGCVHGRCNRPHECVCEEGWGGLLCNEDLKFCSHHKPCKNGALCTNTFDSKGVGSYSCACPQGFSGRDCEMRNQEQIFGVQGSVNTTATGSALSSNSNKSSHITPSSHHQHMHQQVNSNQAPAPKRSASGHNGPFILGGAAAAVVHFSQTGSQHQHHVSSLDGRVMAAYIIIVICMVLFVMVYMLRTFFERTTQRQWNQESHHSEEVATLQNHQNIYKSRSSLGTDKAPFDTVDNHSSSSGSSASTSSTTYDRSGGLSLNENHDSVSNGRIYAPPLPPVGTYQRTSGALAHRLAASTTSMHHNLNHHYQPYPAAHEIYRSHHNMSSLASALNPPPPPYTISHSHPNSTYNNSTYNNSIYNFSTAATTNATSGSTYNSDVRDGATATTSTTSKDSKAAAAAGSETKKSGLPPATSTTAISAASYGSVPPPPLPLTRPPPVPHSFYGNRAATTGALASTNPYGAAGANSTTYQSPYYVIYHIPL